MVDSAMAIGSVAKTCSRFYTHLYRVAAEAGSAGDEMRTFGLHFKTLGDSISTAQYSLQRLLPPQSDSPVMIYLQQHRVLESLCEQSSFTRERMRIHRDKLPNIPSRFEIVTSWRWVRLKEKISELYPSVEAINTVLMVLMLIMQLDQALSQEYGSKTTEDSKMVESKVAEDRKDSHDKTMEDLKNDM
jgi:hypothetical protein